MSVSTSPSTFFFVSCTLLLRYKRCIVLGGSSVHPFLGFIPLAGKSYGAAFSAALDITMSIPHYIIEIFCLNEKYEHISRANAARSNIT
jgi:hypothetical protein